ncbi:MAG TPA: hypothetical protein VHP13_08340 [Gammaproteobacteria bacterium]|jgi:hypothetical protein|nr:hypothetical protein [Gammaproteobacteria bacterium]
MLNRPLLTALLAAAALSGTAAARADDFIVYSAYVTDGQSEVEVRGHQQYDGDPALDSERAYNVALAHAFTPWWHAEVYLGSYEREPGGANTMEGYEFENIFQLTTQGQYWADLGFIASYEYNVLPGEPGVVEFGPLFEKQTGPFNHRLNLIWEKQVGGGAEGRYEFRATYAGIYRTDSHLAPAVEAYYRPADDSRQIGPALYGEIPTTGGNELEFSAAFLVGLNRGAADRTLVFRIEYEFN